MTEVNRYFIAIIPPSPLFDEASRLKQHFADKYNSRAAMKSPPHITLHMPFELKEKKETELIRKLSAFGEAQKKFIVQCHGFGSFAPRVIFVHVVPSNELSGFEKELVRFCKTRFQLFNARYQDRAFHPHLTLAFRDLKKNDFNEAWMEFKNHPLELNFVVNSFHLLRHDSERWNAIAEFPLAAR